MYSSELSINDFTSLRGQQFRDDSTLGTEKTKQVKSINFYVTSFMDNPNGIW